MEISIARGDQKPLNFKIKNNKGELYADIDIDEIILTCRKYPNIESPIIFEKKKSTGDIVYDETSKSFSTLLASNDTNGLDYGTYGFDIEIHIDPIISTKTGVIKITEEYTIQGE